MKNIPLETSETDLYKIFSDHGSLVLCKLNKDKFDRSMGTARIEYETLKGSIEAKEKLDGHKIGE